jgi:hypothetical protein
MFQVNVSNLHAQTKTKDFFFAHGFDSVCLKAFKINRTCIIDSAILVTEEYPFNDFSNVRLSFNQIQRELYLVNSEDKLSFTNNFIVLNKRGNTFSFWLNNDFFKFWTEACFDIIHILDRRKIDGTIEIVLDEKRLLNSIKGIKYAPKRIRIKPNEFINVTKRPRVRMKY